MKLHFESTTAPVNSLDQDFTPKSNGRRDLNDIPKSDESTESLKPVNMKPPPITYELPKLLPDSNTEFRKQEEERLKKLRIFPGSQNQVTNGGLFSQPSRLQSSQNLQSLQSQQTRTSVQVPQQTNKSVPAQAPKQQPKPVATSTASSAAANKRTTFDPDKNLKAFEHFLSPNKKATHKDYDFSRFFNSPAGTTPLPQRRIDSFTFPKIVTTTKSPTSFSGFSTTQKPVTTPSARTTTSRTTTIRNTPSTTPKPVTPSSQNSVTQRAQFQTAPSPKQVPIQTPKPLELNLLPPLFSSPQSSSGSQSVKQFAQQSTVTPVTQQPVRQFSPTQKPVALALQQKQQIKQQPQTQNQVTSSPATKSPTRPSTKKPVESRTQNQGTFHTSQTQFQRPPQIQFPQVQQKTTQPSKQSQISFKNQPVKPQINLQPPLPPLPARSSVATTASIIKNLNPINFLKPAVDLLPPYENSLKSLEDTSTQGPPIYYEWKIPASGLEPPKFDNETETHSNSISHSRRSVQGEATFGENNEFQSASQKKATTAKSTIHAFPYKALQKEFSIPDFDFPLEVNGRDGYDSNQAVNSFQVKIPTIKNVKNQDRFYYLENPNTNCPPECHPQYIKPGSCEPCVRVR